MRLGLRRFAGAANGDAQTLDGLDSSDFALTGHTHPPSGVTDHGALTGLADDDHTQYLLATGTRTGATNQTQVFTGAIQTGSQVIAPNSTGYAFKFDGVSTGFYRDTSDDSFSMVINTSAKMKTDASGAYVAGLMRATQTFQSNIGSNAYMVAVNNGSGTYNQGVFWNGSHLSIPNNRWGIGTITPITQLDVRLNTSAAGTAIHNLITMRANQGSGVGAGYGTALRAGLTSTTTEDQDAGRLTWEWSTATHASRASKGKLSAYYTSTERECIAWEANSTVPLVGFYGVAPVARPAAYTQTYSTAARTVNAYTTDAESAAYTGIDNAQAGTVYAQLTDLNTLRTAYENLRASYDNLLQVVNSLIDDGQAVGLLQ